MKVGGAGGTRTPDPLHAMQVLSQLSYNPTIGPLVGALSGATRPDSSPDCSTGEFRAPRTPASHRFRLAVNEAPRVLIPRQRIGPEDITGVFRPQFAISASKTTAWSTFGVESLHASSFGLDGPLQILFSRKINNVIESGNSLTCVLDCRSCHARRCSFTLSACAATGAPATSDSLEAVRADVLGYFPNVTHAPAIVGVDEGIIDEALGDEVEAQDQVPSTRAPDVVEAIFSDALDISYIGPDPAINAFAQSEGQAVRMIAGSASGGAGARRQRGDHVRGRAGGEEAGDDRSSATPRTSRCARGCRRRAYATDLEGGGDVSIVPQAQRPDARRRSSAATIDGAWVPEPWATRMVQEGDGHGARRRA